MNLSAYAEAPGYEAGDEYDKELLLQPAASPASTSLERDGPRGERDVVSYCIGRASSPPEDGFVRGLVAKKLEERRRVFTRDPGGKAVVLHYRRINSPATDRE